MIWLSELSAKIRNYTAAPFVQTDALVLCAVELAGICDKFVPEAPPLQFDKLPDDGDGIELEVAWYDRRKARTLSVVAEVSGKVYLHLYDDGRGSTNILSPKHDQLKSAVTAFFEGWVPRAD